LPQIAPLGENLALLDLDKCPKRHSNAARTRCETQIAASQQKRRKKNLKVTVSKN
jgi:hypothetical protein